MSSAAMHIARTGLDAQDMRMRVISNNLANVNTTGFKKDRAAFETLAYQTVTTPGAQSTSETKYATGLNLGTGVKIQGTARIDTQGAMQTTGNSLDLALDGDGYFQVQMPGGTLGYTRAGNFSRSAEGLLVTSEGYQVQPGITVPEGTTAITIGSDGTVSATIPARPRRRRSARSRSRTSPTVQGSRRPVTITWSRQPQAARPMSALQGRTAAATSSRACSRRRTSTSSRNSST